MPNTTLSLASALQYVYADGVADTYIQSVVPLGNQFLVNTLTANPQVDPSVGMDAAGNFTIVWLTEGQLVSYFNTIEGQRFDLNGNRLGTEFMVDGWNQTIEDLSPDIAVSPDGYFAVTWAAQLDDGIVWCRVYDAVGAAVTDQFVVAHSADIHYLVGGANGEANPAVAFDAADDFIVTWSFQVLDSTNDYYASGVNVYAKEYSLAPGTGGPQNPVDETNGGGDTGSGTLSVIRPAFRVNEPSYNPASEKLSVDTGNQDYSQPVMDADGDLTVAYSGFSPDVYQSGIDEFIQQQMVASLQYSGQELTFLNVPRSPSLNNAFFTLKVGNTPIPVRIALNDGEIRIANPDGTTSITFDNTELTATAQAIGAALDNNGFPVARIPDNTYPAGYRYAVTASATAAPDGSGNATVVFDINFVTTANASQRPLIGLQSYVDNLHPNLQPTFYATYTQISQASLNAVPALRLFYENLYGLYRGVSAGAMVSQFNPDNGGWANLDTNVVAENQRDGSDASYYLILDQRAVQGQITLVIYPPDGSASVSVSFTPVYEPNNAGIDTGATLTALQTALDSLHLGTKVVTGGVTTYTAVYSAGGCRPTR